MDDLKEHIVTVIFVAGLLLTACGTLLGIVWSNLRESIKDIDNKGSKKFQGWIEEVGEKGGIVTRDDHFAFCKQERAKCAIANILDWKCEMHTKGGPIMKVDHDRFHKEAIMEATTQLSQDFLKEIRHNRELMVTELKLIQATIENKVVSEIAAIKTEIAKQAKSNGSK